MSELKRCPFCGGNNVGVWRDRKIGLTTLQETYEVRCYDCHFGLAPSRTAEEAINAWNTRTPVENLITALNNHPNLFTELGWENFYISINDVIETIKERM